MQHYNTIYSIHLLMVKKNLHNYYQVYHYLYLKNLHYFL